MPISLPKPIAAYFAAEKAGEPVRSPDASRRMALSVMKVESSPGTYAIERWNADARAKYHHTVVPLSVTEGDGAIVVRARVAGDFPGSPVDLQHIFRLGGHKITSLEIR